MRNWEFMLASEDSYRKPGITLWPWGYTTPLPESYVIHPFSGVPYSIGVINFEIPFTNGNIGRLMLNGGPMAKFPVPTEPSKEFHVYRFLYDGQWWEFKYRIMENDE